MSYSTKDALCTAALSYIGEPSVTPFEGSGTTTMDEACRVHYQAVVEHVLTSHLWDVATGIADLVPTDPAPDVVLPDFKVAHDLPDDYLRLHEIILNNGVRVARVKLADGKLWLDSAYDGVLVYVRNDILPSAMPPTLADCIMFELATRVSLSVTQNHIRAEQMQARYKEAFARATATESQMSISGENSSPIAQASRTEVYNSRFRRGLSRQFYTNVAPPP